MPEQNIVDSTNNDSHTKLMEDMWMSLNNKLKQQFGTSHDLFLTFLNESGVANFVAKT